MGYLQASHDACKSGSWPTLNPLHIPWVVTGALSALVGMATAVKIVHFNLYICKKNMLGHCIIFLNMLK